MRLALGIANRQPGRAFRDLDSSQLLPILQPDRHVSKGGSNDTTRFQDRFNKMDSGKAPADTGEVGTDSPAAVCQTVTLGAPGSLLLEVEFAPTARVSARGQRELRQPLVSFCRALAAK